MVAFANDVRESRRCEVEELDLTPRAHKPTAPTRPVNIVFDRTGRRLAAACDDGKVWLWDLRSGERQWVSLGPNFTVRAAAFVDGGRLAAAGGNWLRRQGLLKTWNLNTGEEATLWNHDRPITALAASNDGVLLTAGSGDGILRIWNRTNSVDSIQRRGHDDEITSLAHAPDGSQLVSGGADQALRTWTLHLEPKRHWRGHERPVRGVAFERDGRRFGSVDERSLFVWNAESGRAVARYDVPSGDLTRIAFVPGRSCITADNSSPSSSSLRVWDLHSGASRIFWRHSRRITAIARSNRGDWALAQDNGDIQVLNAAAWLIAVNGQSRKNGRIHLPRSLLCHDQLNSDVDNDD
jgi:WD40 repeat protein